MTSDRKSIHREDTMDRITPKDVAMARALTGLKPVNLFYWALTDGRADPVLAVAYDRTSGDAREELAAFVRGGQVSCWKILLDEHQMTLRTAAITGLPADYIRGFRFGYHHLASGGREWLATYPERRARQIARKQSEDYYRGCLDGQRVARKD